jgi:threonine/homoserine/homoserine lactone efflux protein
VNLVEILIKGIVLGFLSSIPLGPIGMICIQRTLGKGRWSGFVSGLGAASADTILAIVAGLGLSFVIDFVTGHMIYLKILGGLVLIFLGIRIFLKDPAKQVRLRKLNKSTHHTDYLSVLALTLTNPIAIFLFVALFTGLNLLNGSKHSFSHYLVFPGIFIGASLWWFTLTSLVNIYRDKFRLKSLWWLNKITGGLIGIFGLTALVIGIMGLIKILTN